MSTITPSPRTWTLFFKHHRTTVLVHADPLQRWPLVRADLLRALHQTHPDGMLDGQRIPMDHSDVRLAVPVDPHDLAQGWTALDAEPGFGDSVSGKGKAKVGATPKGKSGKDTMRDCPQGAGLKEGSVLAFKFRVEEDGSAEEKAAVDALDGDALAGELEPEAWDVVVPNLEDIYDEDEPVSDEGVGMDDVNG